MAKRHSVSVWLDEIFFEDNSHFGRRAPRAAGLLRKIAATVPQAFSMIFCNFASTYPRAKAQREPQPVAPSLLDQLSLRSWPIHPETGAARGLPHADATARRIDAGDTLAETGDLVFAMKELHRVCVDEGEVEAGLTDPAAARRDPTLVRAVTAELLDFFTDQPLDAPLAARAEAAGVRGLFTLVRQSETGVTLRARKPLASPPRPTRIDIGCGTSVQPGYSGLDILPLPGVEIVRDVDRHGLPFSDSTISHVYTAHFLEHVRHLVFVMNEIHRVCCHDAIVEVSVPSLLGPYAAADPTHARLFNARTFSYFEAGRDPYAGIVPGFEILEQHAGFSIVATLRVIKEPAGP